MKPYLSQSERQIIQGYRSGKLKDPCFRSFSDQYERVKALHDLGKAILNSWPGRLFHFLLTLKK